MRESFLHLRSKSLFSEKPDILPDQLRLHVSTNAGQRANPVKYLYQWRKKFVSMGRDVSPPAWDGGGLPLGQAWRRRKTFPEPA